MREAATEYKTENRTKLTKGAKPTGCIQGQRDQQNVQGRKQD